MAAVLFFSVFLIFCSATISAQNLAVGSRCTTPNNEVATCLRVSSCQVIKDAIGTRNAAALDFASKSQCGYDREYLVCCGTTGVPNGPIYQHPLLPNSSFCGTQTVVPKIYGGLDTDLGEFPWMALLKYREEGQDVFRCGGTLISQRYVLTAAHCTKLNPNLDYRLSGVRLGEYNKTSDPDCQGVGIYKTCADLVVDVGVERVINHEDFRKKFLINDISLIRLDRDVSFTSFIRPICLSSGFQTLPKSTNLTFSGWGETEFAAGQSENKLKVALPVTDSQECGVKLRTTIIDTQFCAGGDEMRDTCGGDSGGPAMRVVGNDQQQQWIQEGIVSYGHFDCGIAGQSGVYTRVSQYKTWITNNMQR